MAEVNTAVENIPLCVCGLLSIDHLQGLSLYKTTSIEAALITNLHLSGTIGSLKMKNKTQCQNFHQTNSCPFLVPCDIFEVSFHKARQGYWNGSCKVCLSFGISVAQPLKEAHHYVSLFTSQHATLLCILFKFFCLFIAAMYITLL